MASLLVSTSADGLRSSDLALTAVYEEVTAGDVTVFVTTSQRVFIVNLAILLREVS